jgi:RHS repeat-associated protein
MKRLLLTDLAGIGSAPGAPYLDFGARLYSPRTAAWLSPDPLAEKYYGISPYAYCRNNPTNFIDPDGRKVVGLTKKDALKVQQDFNTMFAGEKFNKFRGLFTLNKKGTTFNSISTEAINVAFDGVTLSADEQALVNEAAGVINSEFVHKVEFVSIDGSVSKEGTSAFKTHLNNTQTGVGDAMISSANMPGTTMNAVSGGGINIPTKNGSHSVIMEGKGVVHDGGRAVTTGHEVVGHGVASANKATPLENNTRAIRVDNLIRRVMGITIFRTEHGGAIIVDPYALP